MKNLSKQAEEQAMAALKAAVSMANDGMTPSDALAKAAEDAQLPPQMVQRLVEAFNTSKTLSHFKKAEAKDKAKSFPLAEASTVLGRLFPENPETPQTKAAGELHPDYWDPTLVVEMEKAAMPALPPMVETPPEPYERDPAAFAKAALDFRNKIASGLNAVEGAYREYFYRVMGEMDKVAAYWRQARPVIPFDLVEKRAYARYGKASVPFMEMVYRNGNLSDHRLQVKRAAAEELGQQEMSFPGDTEPYCHIASAMLFAKVADEFRKEAAGIRDLLHEHALQSANYLPVRTVEQAINYVLDKEAKKRDMPSFTKQDRPKKVKEIYKALKRDHPGMPAEMKARIAARQGKKGKQKQGPPYKGPLTKKKSDAPLANMFK
jgi:hypothetical protein